jgi:uncharacterized protein YndB with AHSA1/START domain
VSEREVGRTKDVGYQIGVRRTVPHSVEDVWDLLVSPEGLSVWLGPGVELTPEKSAPYSAENGTSGEVRSFREHDRIRVTWQPADWSHETTVQVALLPAATGTALLFHQEHLADSDERERQREHWRGVIDDLVALQDSRT